MPRYDKLSRRDVEGMFYQEYNSSSDSSWVSEIANEFTSDQDFETYPWIGANSRMAEIVGGTQETEHNVFSLTVTNSHYGNAIVIKEKDLRRDKTEQIQTRLGELADDAVGFDSYKLSELIIAGESSLCYDNQYFYDTDHESGSSGTQSNIVTVDISTLPALVHGSTASNPSPEEIQQSVGQCIARMMSFKNDKGNQENRNATSFTVMLPFGLWNVMFNSAAMPNNAGVSAQPVINMGKFSIKYELNFELSAWTDQFVVFRTDARTKSFIVQEETPIRMQLEDTPKSKNAYTYRWAIDTWKGYGYGRWERSVLCKLV